MYSAYIKRRQSTLRPRTRDRPSVVRKERRWYLCSLKHKNPGPFCIVYLHEETQTFWTTKRLRMTLAVVIPIFLFIGIGFITSGLARALGYKSYFNAPIIVEGDNLDELYWGQSVLGFILIFIVIIGIYGIFSSKDEALKAYAIMSFVYGHTTFTIAVGWIVILHFGLEFEKLKVLSSILSVILFLRTTKKRGYVYSV